MPDHRWARLGPLAGLGLALPLLVFRFGPSEGVTGVLMVLGMITLVVGGALAAWWYTTQRAKALAAWAATIGWTYLGTDPSLATRWQGAPFGIGGSRRVSELITGTYGGAPATSFTYRYTTGSGKNRQVHVFHVVSLGLPTWLPGLQLTPQGVGARIVTALGGQDLEFESEDFNRQWRVEARDEKYAHDVLHPRTLERLVRPDARGLSLRLAGTDVISWAPGATDPETLAGRLGVMRALVDGIPRFVWLDNGYDPSSGRRTDEAWPPPPPELPGAPAPPEPPRYDRQHPSKESPTWTP